MDCASQVLFCSSSKLGSNPTPWSGPFRDHGLRPRPQSPSEHCKPYAWRVFCVWSTHFWIWSPRAPRLRVGVHPCLLIHAMPRRRESRMGGVPGRGVSQYPLTRNYYENNSPRIMFRNFWGNSHPLDLRERLFPEITREIPSFSTIIISA